MTNAKKTSSATPAHEANIAAQNGKPATPAKVVEPTKAQASANAKADKLNPPTEKVKPGDAKKLAQEALAVEIKEALRHRGSMQEALQKSLEILHEFCTQYPTASVKSEIDSILNVSHTVRLCNVITKHWNIIVDTDTGATKQVTDNKKKKKPVKLKMNAGILTSAYWKDDLPKTPKKPKEVFKSLAAAKLELTSKYQKAEKAVIKLAITSPALRDKTSEELATTLGVKVSLVDEVKEAAGMEVNTTPIATRETDNEDIADNIADAEIGALFNTPVTEGTPTGQEYAQ